MKLSEIAKILGIEVIDVITFDQSLMDNKTVRDAVKVVDAAALESFEIDNREAQFIIVALGKPRSIDQLRWLVTQAPEIDFTQDRCGCESSECTVHAANEIGVSYCAAVLSEPQEDSPHMLYVGRVCIPCAESLSSTDGARYVTAPYGTWNGR